MLLKTVSYPKYEEKIKALAPLNTVISTLLDKNITFYRYDASQIIILIKKENGINECLAIGGITIPDDFDSTVTTILKDYHPGEFIYDLKRGLILEQFGNPYDSVENFFSTPFPELNGGKSDISKVLVREITPTGEVKFYSYWTVTGFSTLYRFYERHRTTFKKISENGVIHKPTLYIILKLMSKKFGYQEMSTANFKNLDDSFYEKLSPNRFQYKVNTQRLLKFINGYKPVEPPSQLFLDAVFLKKFKEGITFPDGEMKFDFTIQEIKRVFILENKLIFETTLDDDSISEMFGIGFDKFDVISEFKENK